MVAWFIIAIGTIALFAVIAFSGVEVTTNVQDLSARTESVNRVQAVADALEERVTAPFNDGVLYAPAGAVKNGRYSLPNDLASMGTTPYGAPMAYCPMSYGSGATNVTVLTPGGNYAVRTQEAPNGKSYVVNGRPSGAAGSDPNVIAHVIAPINRGGTPAGCSAITFDGANFQAPNSIVRTIRRSKAGNSDKVRISGGSVWYVSPQGEGDGRSPGSPTNISTAVNAFKSSLGDSFTIRFAAGSYSLERNSLDKDSAGILPKKANSTLSLIGPTDGMANLSMSGFIYVPANLHIERISMPNVPVIASDQRTVDLKTASIGNLTVYDQSSVQMSGGVTVTAADNLDAINLVNGSNLTAVGPVSLRYASNNGAMIIHSGSEASFTSSDLTIEPKNQGAASTTPFYFLYMLAGGEFSMRGSNINFNGKGTYPNLVAGRLTALNSNMNFNADAFVGVQMYYPGRPSITWWNGTIGGSVAPQYGFATQKTGSIIGAMDIYSRIRCWYDDGTTLFRLSAVGRTGNISTVTADEVPPAMSPQPTAAQVQAYQAAVNRNTQRQELRNQLHPSSGGFVCRSSS